MGQKNEGGDGTTKGGGGGGKAKEQKNAHAVVVLKIDLHCGGCEAKIDRFLKKFPGVEKTKVDGRAMKVTVEGKVDPAKLREKLQEKTKKKVELVSPLPKKEKDQADKEKKEKPKEPPVTTVVLKFSSLHCEGCIRKIHKIITRTKGVMDVAFNRDKDTATVRGAMEAKALAESLREHMKRAVEIVPPKKEKESGGSGGEAKDKKGGGGCGGRVEGQRMEYQGARGCGYGYGYGGVYWEAVQLHAPQLFSDENPNACSVM
ncbi:heavy metal-associated isoprenylated plant protein 3-like [Rhodamnia argentea]|uniref:Heavy metal-associated isoprenylated plant protein 3-like n=1 Tax=Rhodamnia argentea TaxID=178133 RepID=A0A8B8R0F4_9MYRT|nr:heavy metal-associated isoprenylated plant protein 3-like [Rhodamnia argentea]